MVIVVLCLLLFIITPSICNSDISCSSFLNCNSCTSTIFLSHPSCHWNNNKCEEYIKDIIRNFDDTNWFNYFSECYNEPNSKELMDRYTEGERENDKFPDEIKFRSINGIYAPSSFYCEWKKSFSLKEGKKVMFKIERVIYDTDDRLVFQFGFDNKTENYVINDSRNRGIIISNIKNVTFFYFSSSKKTQPPFSIKVSLYKSQNKNIYLIIVLVIVIIIIIGVIFAYLKYRKRRGKRKLNSKIKESQIVITPINNTYNGNSIMHQFNQYKMGLSNVNENDELTKERNILNSELEPKIYKKDSGVYKDICTICSTEIKNKEKIVILQCKHLYHYKCIKDNLKKKKDKCPNCNSKTDSNVTVTTYKIGNQ